MTDLAFGLNLTAIGMGLVFALLGLLWLLLNLVSRLDAALPPAEAPAPGGDEAPPAGAPPALEAEVLAAVGMAVALHAAHLRREAAPAQRSTQPGSQIFASRWLAAGRTRQTGSFTPRR